MDVQSANIMQSVIRALDADRGAEAVHQFMQALSHDSALKAVDLPPVLAKSLGKARTAALTEAFARHPCMVCRRGLLRCDECKGSGHFGLERTCDLCVGLGVANCDFCAGSGWITYNYVPVGLRAPVVLARCKLALAEARELLAVPVPNPRTGSVSVSRKELARRLLRVNRLLGAFSNALGIARHTADAGATASAVLKKVEVACLKAADKLDRRLRQLLLLLGENARVQAARSSDSRKRTLAERRATFYEVRAKSPDFKGTSLHHVHLGRLPQRQAPPAPAPPAAQVPPSEESD